MVVASVVPVTVGVMVETWLCEFLLPGTMAKNKFLKVSINDLRLQLVYNSTIHALVSMSILNLFIYI